MSVTMASPLHAEAKICSDMAFMNTAGAYTMSQRIEIVIQVYLWATQEIARSGESPSLQEINGFILSLKVS